MKETIQQIMPLQTKLFAVYHDKGELIPEEVFGMALVSIHDPNAEPRQELKPITIVGGDFSPDADMCDNYVGVFADINDPEIKALIGVKK